MGIVFPFYALLFARFGSRRDLALFSAGCLAAGITVGFVCYLIGKRLLLDWIDAKSKGLGRLGVSDSILDLGASRDLGEINANFTRFFTALDAELKRVRDESNRAAEAVSAVGSDLEAITGTLERLSTSSERGEQALERLTGKLSDVSAMGIELADSGSEADAVLRNEEKMFTELASSGQQLARTQDDISSMIQKELGRYLELDGIVSNGENAFSELRRLQDRIVSVLELLLGAVASMEEITARSNLLAINTSIEAARVGSAGSGFKVIAAEMRGQSEENSQQARLLAENLESLKADLSGGEEAIKEALGVFESLRGGIESGVGSLKGMDLAAERSKTDGTALLKKLEDFQRLFSRLTDLTAELSASSVGFSSLKDTTEIDRTRATLSEILGGFSALSSYRVEMKGQMELLSGAVGQIKSLLSRFRLLG